MTEEILKERKLAFFRKIDKANKEGYAGCMPNGNLVDRREQPEAHPVPENIIFNVSKPRCIRCENETAELVKSLCRKCRTVSLEIT